MGPTAFRDGIFSSSEPMSKYGVLLTTYSDGSLGASQKIGRPVQETADQTYDDYVSEYDDGPNYALWGLIGAGVLVAGGAAYMMLKK